MLTVQIAPVFFGLSTKSTSILRAVSNHEKHGKFNVNSHLLQNIGEGALDEIEVLRLFGFCFLCSMMVMVKT